jgi:hypothetical protein
MKKKSFNKFYRRTLLTKLILLQLLHVDIIVPGKKKIIIKSIEDYWYSKTYDPASIAVSMLPNLEYPLKGLPKWKSLI